MKKIATISCLLLICMLSACSSVSVSDYENNKPLLITRDFFNGNLTAHGVVKNRSGKVIRTFNADIKAYWKDGVGTLEEDFVFDDGEQQRRVWTLTPDGENRFIGTANDVVGESLVTVAGNSMFLEYTLRIPYGDDTIDVTIDDRMYLVSPEVLINESRLSKFGVNVGSLLLVIEKRTF